MAHPRSHRAILERPRRRWLWLALSGALIALAVGSGFFLHRERQPVVSQALAIPPLQGRLTVEVLNGTRRQGVARTATRMLRRRGLDVVHLGNADSVETSTRVIVRRGDAARAQYVTRVLGAGRIVVEPDTFRRVDVTVILGDDFRPRLRVHP